MITGMADTSLRALLQIRGFRLADLARMTSVDKATVTRWAQRRVPAERVREIERLTGIPAEQIRPDIFQTNEVDR